MPHAARLFSGSQRKISAQVSPSGKNNTLFYYYLVTELLSVLARYFRTEKKQNKTTSCKTCGVTLVQTTVEKKITKNNSNVTVILDDIY